MPEVGETKQVYIKESRKHIWVKCPDCSGERWMQERNFKRGGSTGLCLACYNRRVKKSKKLHPNWRGSKATNGHGYILILLQPDDFFFPMTNARGYVREHRLVMAKHLGRCLHNWEIVHHEEGIPKDDNRIEGLSLATKDGHDTTTILQNRIKILETKIKRLQEIQRE